MKKRVLSLLMAIAICLSMLPSAALAEIPGTGTNEVQTEQQITDEQKPEEQNPDKQNPDEQKPEEQNPDEQNPDKQNPDEQNPDEQKPAKAPRKVQTAETHTGDHGEYTLPKGATWQGVDSLPSDSGYYYLTKDVTISSTWKPADGTVLCLNGYGISLNGNGPVIEVQPDVTFTLCDCNGSGKGGGITHASSSNGRGAGVLVGQSAVTEDTARTNTAVFNMYGGAIYNNYPWEAGGENAASASGVLIGGGTFNMYGGKITGNGLTDVESLGGGVFVANQGSFLMRGGEISGNHATEGGGVFVGGSYGYHDFSASAGGTFTMSGGKITGNSGTGGGVYVSSGSDTSFTVSGSAQITGNTGSNVYLGEYKGQSNTIKVDGVLDRTASIGVSVETANQVVAENISAENAKRFTSDNSKYSLQYDSTSQTLTLVGHDKHPICGDVNCKEHETISWTAVSDLTKITRAGYYYLTQDVEIKDSWSPANGVTLCLNGHSITLVGYDNPSVIELNSGIFTLCDCSGGKGKITHGYKTGSKIKYTGRGVSVYGGMFTMYGGSITGNDYDYSGGGVHVRNATFNMYGGSITGNTSSPAGGVYVNEKGTFNMNGGEISGNTSSSYGGGVYVYNGAEFTMTDGSITGNAASSNENKSYGGGVYVQKDAIKFTMTGGSITGNKAMYGGGVWTGASFTVSGNVNITGNVGIDSKTASNVYPSLVKITIGGEGLKPEARIGVTSNTIDPGKYVTIATGAKDSCTVDNFTADAGEPYGIKVESTGTGVDVNLYNGLPHIHYRCNGKDENGAEMCNRIGHKEDNVLEFTPWTDANELPTASGHYYLTKDVTLDSAWEIKYTSNSQVRFVLCLNGHSIKLKDGVSGNVINIGKNATLALCDCNGSNAGNGKITGSKASGVNIEYNGAFVMYGGSISGNGTGVSNGMQFQMYGGSITGNNRGVNVNSNDFIVAGKVNITGNTSNVYLPAGKTITVSGALGTGAQIGVTTAKELAEGSYLTIAKGIDTDSSKYTLTETDLNAFTSDSSYDKRLNGNSIIFTKGDLHIHALCGASCTHNGTHTNIVWQPLTYDAKTQTLYYGGTAVPNEVKEHITGYDENNNAVRGKYRLHTLPSGNYYLMEDITLAGGTVGQDEIVGGEIYIKGYDANVNLCLNGHTLSATNANSAVISVKETQKLTMCDCEGGGKLQTATNGNIVVQAYGDRDHNRIGTFTMYGGTISGARFGVWATNGCGSFNMFGGTITGNEYGVSISSDASFTIGGTVNITGNKKNVDLGENVTITIDKSLTQEARIGITIAKEPTADNPVQFATGANNAALDYTKIFTPDAKDKSYVVSKGEDGSLFLGLHRHNWSYTANGATITAMCTADGCPLENKNGGSYTITAPDNLIYDGNGKAATVTGSIPDVTAPTITYKKGDTTLGSAPTDVGKYTASITLGEGENAKTARVEYSITAKEVTVTGITATDRYYAKDNLEVTLTGGTLTGVISGDTVTIDLINAKGTMTDANAGTGKAVTVTGVALGGADKGNYKLKEQPTGVTVNITRADAGVIITGAPTSKTYGDADFTVTAANGVTESTGNTGKWTWTSSDDTVLKIVSGGNSATATVQVLKASAIGVTLTATYDSDTHMGTATTAAITVAPKTLTADDLEFTTDSTFTKIYDGSTSFTKASVEIKSGAKVNVTDVLPAVNGSYVYNSKDVKDAQKVIFTSEKTESENYILPAGLVVEREAKIEPAAITVTPNAVSKTYGAADPELTYGVSGAVNSETPAFTGALARAEGKNVGDYAINQGTLALADKDTFKAGNYKLKFTSKVNLTITKAKPEITASSKQITKNGVEVDITRWATFKNTDSDAKLTYTLVGAPIGITLTGNKLKADPSTTTTTFSIKVNAAATTNFTAPDEVTFTVTVVNKDNAGVIITGAPTSKTYGDADFTVTAANGVTETTGNNGKWTWTSSDSNILEITSGADTATPTIKVKKADTTGATLTATYSSITHYGTANVTIKVNKKDVTITGLSAGNKDYDRSTSATPTGTAVIDGKVGSDDVTVTAGTASFDNENVGTDKTVTFTGYSLSGADAGNYNLKAQPASVTANIAAKDVKLTGGINATDRSYVKDNKTVDLTKGTLTFDGLVSGETLDVNLPATGTISDAKVGVYNVAYSGVTLKDGTGKASNYKLVSPLPTVTVNITKATAPTLKNITVSQKYSVTTGEKAIGTVMPADAGTLTYAKGTESKTGSVKVTNWAVDATGKVTYTLSGGAAGDTVTLPVIIGSDNYADATVNVAITLTAKDIPNVTARDIVVTYDGNPIPADKITGTADVAGTWKWKAGTAVTDVSDSGTKTVVFKPADSVNYAEVEKTITVTINRATPTGEPKYTEITTGGKTLADAALMLAGGTIPFDEGALEWIDEKGNKLSDETVVEANKSYTWRFIPADANYAPLTGTIVLYPASTGIVIYTPVNDAIFLSGANQIVAPGSAATFRINKNFGEFRSVAVDGVTLDKSNYRAWSGSTYVKLTPAYMKTLSAGTHTLAVYFTGATATTTFTISAGSSNPATGASDFAGVGAAVAMAAVSLLGAAAVLRRK